ncbi:MAG: nitroreductase family protein [Rhodanobacter sp.]
MNAALTLTAQSAGSSFANDPELQLPEHPRFPPEILVIPYGQSGLLFEGANGTQVLNGRGARGVIPMLLQRFDGHHTLSELYESMPDIPSGAVRDVVALLYSRGLLEDGIGPVGSDGLAEIASFVGRYSDVTRVNRNRGEAIERLAQARVVIAGDRVSAEALSAALKSQGLAAVSLLNNPAQLEDDTALVIAMFVDDANASTAWLKVAHARGLHVLHAHLGADAVEIGPLFMPGRSACYACLRQLHDAPRGAVRVEDVGFWAGVVALHAFHLLSRVGRPTLYNTCHLHTRTANGEIYREMRIARLPGCDACGLSGRAPGLHEKNGLIWLLHNAANSMPPRQLLNPRDYQMHYAPANVQITRDVPDPYYGAVPTSLPEGAPLPGGTSWMAGPRPLPAQTPDADLLATLLRVAVGYHQTDAGVRRVAPSGGGLGSAELFLVARGVTGLEDGVYHYYAQAHRLDRLREVSPVVMAGALGIGEPELPPLLLVGVGSLTKLRQKYGNFAFRFSNLDAGFARIYLYECLKALGLPFVDYRDVRDKVLAGTIGLPTIGARNTITYAIGVGAPREQVDVASVDPHQYVDVLIDMASKRDAAAEHREAKHGSGVATDRVWPAPVIQSLGEILRQRRSVRSFAPRPIPAEILDAIAALAIDANALIGRCGGLPMPLNLWVGVTVGDETIPPGVYRWDAVRGELQLRRADLHVDELDATMLQRSLARAPVVFFITGNFEEAVLDHGARGYRELFSRAGAIGARALIAATSYGVSGCPWGGLIEDAWGDLFDIDRYRDCPLFGLSLGYANEA